MLLANMLAMVETSYPKDTIFYLSPQPQLLRNRSPTLSRVGAITIRRINRGTETDAPAPAYRKAAACH